MIILCLISVVYYVVVSVVLLVRAVKHVRINKYLVRQVTDVSQFSDRNPELPSQESVDETCTTKIGFYWKKLMKYISFEDTVPP